MSVPFVVGAAQLIQAAVPLGVFALVYFVFISCVDHEDIYRYGLAGYSLAVVVGFDPVWSSPQFAKLRWALAPFYVALVLWYHLGRFRRTARKCRG
jgi:hypothetical protein